ncbi:MAG: alpha-glucosidase [Lachnospiraceae bacterium]|nr:alpha-glucosidase [Lachnospiraceae bacterium]
MIKKYVFGTPVETEAVVQAIPVTEKTISRFEFQNNQFIYQMTEKTKVYGLGEANRGINKRGYRYVSFCSDEPSHTEEKESLYGAHNFLVIDDENPFGVFIDNPGKVTFDLGYEEINQLVITPKYMDMYIYLIEGNTPLDIIRQFRKMIGKSYIPPKWAFGFGQCRWSYENSGRVDDVIRNYEEHQMLISSVYLDIDYMQDYKDFTINEERFPDFKDYVSKVRKKGIRLVPIIDAGVKIEEGYHVYEEGVKNRFFVKDINGEDYITAVWPGYTHFPDFLNSKARAWFGEKYRFLLDLGIEGFWNDMNEPAIFYSKNMVERLKKRIKESDIEHDDQVLMDDIRWKLTGVANNSEDYQSMYHDMNGERINHDKVHNLYGYHMSRAAAEAFEKLVPDKKILMFSRSSYIGMHRYCGIWMGDNCSWWSHILLNLKMLPSLNMCGFMYIGADVGGFGCNATEDLVMRWMALGVFTPLFRNHSAFGTRNQECYQFTDTAAFKNIIDVRYRLMPYIYDVYLKSVENDDMMYSPLAFVYPEDEIASGIEDQLLLGEDIMIAPVYLQNAIGRYVYLPENMTFVKFERDGKTVCESMRKGVHFVKIARDEVPLFIRENHQVKIVRQSVITDASLREKIMDCSICYREEDFEYLQ